MDHRVSKDMISSGMTPSGKKSQADLGKTQYGSAPSPSRLMDAYQSMYEDQKKEENINELKTRTMLDYIDKASDSASKELGKAEKTTSRKKETKARLKMDQRERGIEMAKGKIMKRVNDSVDLLAAYSAVYEHHQKDENGNTIPHDDVKEGKLNPGLQAFLDKKKGKKKDDDGDKKKDKKDMKEGTDLFDTVILEFVNQGYDENDVIQAMSSLNEQELQELQNLDEAIPIIAAALKPLAAIAKGSIGKTMTRAAIKMGGKSAGKIMKPIGKIVDNPMVQMQAMSSGNQPKEKVNKTGVTSNQPTAVAASADLFDIVKGQLLDEGLSEEEIKDIMLELTPEEILNEISGKLAMQASKAADMKRSELAKAGDKSGAADKAAQSSRLYKKGSERNLAKQDLSKPLNPQRTDYPMGKGANYQQKPGM